MAVVASEFIGIIGRSGTIQPALLGAPRLLYWYRRTRSTYSSVVYLFGATYIPGTRESTCNTRSWVCPDNTVGADTFDSRDGNSNTRCDRFPHKKMPRIPESVATVVPTNGTTVPEKQSHKIRWWLRTHFCIRITFAVP